jgi:hypothetical protein
MKMKKHNVTLPVCNPQDLSIEGAQAFGITEEGAQAFAQNRTLNTLDISCNNISIEGAQAIVQSQHRLTR